MFLHIQHNPSGEVLHQRRLSPTETLCPEALTDRYLNGTELERMAPDGYIPAGCADYRTEIRIEKHHDVVIWTGLDWFGSMR
jgi:hypothetical protein